MLEGMMQAYLEAFGRGWRPHDDLHARLRDSPGQFSALQSRSFREGDLRHDETSDRGKRIGFGARRLREC